LSFFSSSVSISPRIFIEPLPVLYPVFIASFPIIKPPVGKSGPGISLINSSIEISLLSI